MIFEPFREAAFQAPKVCARTICEKAARRKPQGRVSPRRGYIDVSKATEARLVGYARVSTDEQTTRLQLDALKAAGCHRIFQDKLGGALASRPQMDRALGELRAGDTLVVWKLDRLGRSLRNLLEIAEVLRERDIAAIADRAPRYGDCRRQNALFRSRRRRAVRAGRPARTNRRWDTRRSGTRGARRAPSRTHRFPSSGGA